ncbi:hypothetical protein PFLU4_58740 [Pseudomonas fluorescens]|nr:hypothetical protein PFLU4_58740 [Pseudomonas fluorescens]
MDQALVLISFKQRQLSDERAAVGNHALQQSRPVPGHALDRGGVEQIVGIGQRRVQLAGLFPGVEGQVELRGAALPFQHRQLQPRGRANTGDVGHLRLVVVHHLEQRCVAEAALQFQGFHQPFERQVLMGLGAEGRFLDHVQQLIDTGLAAELGAQYLGVDEETDQPFGFRAVAVGDGHADADIGVAGVAMQQYVERAEQEHEQGDVVLLGGGAQLLS